VEGFLGGFTSHEALLCEDLYLIGNDGIDGDAEKHSHDELFVLYSKEVIASLVHVVCKTWTIDKCTEQPGFIEDNKDEEGNSKPDDQAK
jgi:hypothetical protein